MPKKNRHLKPRPLWADYDPHARRGNKWAFYTTRADQHANRPDLPPIRGVFVPAPFLSAAVASQEAASDMHETIDNLALLLRRAARKIDPCDPLRTECVAYLKRIGQAGNPLRSLTTVENPVAEIAHIMGALPNPKP